MPDKLEVNVLSLFSGAGGLDIGFHNSGFNIVSCVEIEKIFCKTLELNRNIAQYVSSDCQIFNVDITGFDVNLLSNKKIDFVIGGPPCQTYSASGRRIGGAPGLDDLRGRLFEHYCRILEQLNPKGFVFENVRGLLGVNKGEAWKAILAAFSGLGYNLFHAVLDAAAYGVPQHRERVFLVGLKTEQLFLFPNPLFGPDSTQKVPYVSAGDAIEDLQDINEPYHQYNGKYGYLLSDIPEGMNYSFYTAEMGHPAPVFAWRSKFSSFLYKIAQDKPVKTIQAQLGKFAGPFHWKNRRLTVAELKRLQSFPDNYEFAGSYNQVAEQIGNSVPPLLATYLAQAVMRQVFDNTAYPELELMPLNFEQSYDARKGLAAAKTRNLTRKVKTSLSDHLSLWEDTNKVELTIKSPDILDDAKFAFCYTSTVNKNIITAEELIGLAEIKPKQSLSLKSPEIFLVEIQRDTQSVKNLQIKVINLDFIQGGQACWHLHLQLLIPLSDGTSNIELTLFSHNLQHVYVAWDTIEEVIKKRSAYISLVGLYGHFAEPHPKFNVSISNLASSGTELSKLVEYYSQFSNCGRNIAGKVIARDIGISEARLASLMRQLRDIRYDLRSNQTNSRIPEGHYFCAYPFPELSASYQLNKIV